MAPVTRPRRNQQNNMNRDESADSSSQGAADGGSGAPPQRSLMRDRYATAVPNMNRDVRNMDRSRSNSPEEPASPQFYATQSFGNLVDEDGNTVRPIINATVEKGLFSGMEDSYYCFRRNYFRVHVSYDLQPSPVREGGLLFLQSMDGNSRYASHQVQAIGLKLASVTDEKDAQNIQLVQMTPKRDKGPTFDIRIAKLLPIPCGPANTHVTLRGHHAIPNYILPGHLDETANEYTARKEEAMLEVEPTDTTKCWIPGPGHNSTSYTFERIQFRHATVNNGKRRAAQQFFRIVIEMHAFVKLDAHRPGEWVQVCQSASDQVVVRGRSPSHYMGVDEKMRRDKEMIKARMEAPIMENQAWTNITPDFNTYDRYAATNGPQCYTPVTTSQSSMPIYAVAAPSQHHGDMQSMNLYNGMGLHPDNYRRRADHDQISPEYGYGMDVSRQDGHSLPPQSVPMTPAHSESSHTLSVQSYAADQHTTQPQSMPHYSAYSHPGQSHQVQYTQDEYPYHGHQPAHPHMPVRMSSNQHMSHYGAQTQA